MQSNFQLTKAVEVSFAYLKARMNEKIGMKTLIPIRCFGFLYNFLVTLTSNCKCKALI
jgi:hypothetical protein